MTICLAALAIEGDQQVAVVAADRMVTLGNFMEFEHQIPKMVVSSNVSVVMIAGDTLIGTSLAKDVAAQLQAGGVPTSGEIAGALAAAYGEVRKQKLEQEILSPRGLSLAEFYGRHTSLNAQIAAMIDQQMAQYNLGVELLLAGVDAGAAHLFTVHNPGGGHLEHDVIGYAAIGSGAIHALQSMIGFGHHAGVPLADAVFHVYASKRRSEVAPGVGEDTDLAIISPHGIQALEADRLKELQEIYEERQKSSQDALTDKLQSLRITSAEARSHDVSA